MKHFRKIRTAACAFVLSASFLLPATGSSFVAYADEKSEIEEIKKKNEERERKKAAAQDKLNSLNIEANKIEDIISELDQEICAAQENIRELTASRNAIQAEIAVTESNLQIAYISEANQYERMKERIAYAYENGDVQYLDALMAIDDFSNIINQSEYVEQISAYDQTQLNELIEIKKNIMEQENLLADKLAEVEDIKAAKEKLMNSAQQLFTKMYEQMQGAQGGQGAGPDMGGFQQTSGNNGNDDNVVDGDYREV